MNGKIKKLIFGLVILLVVGLSLLLIFQDSEERIDYLDNKFVTDHITGEVYHRDYSQYDYLKYEFASALVEDYEFDVLVYQEDRLVLEELNLVEGMNDNKFYFDLYLGEEFSVGDYNLIVKFRDLSSGKDFEIVDDFNVVEDKLLMSEPVATTVNEGVMIDYRRIPVYAQGEVINVYYKVFNMEVSAGKVSLGTGIVLFDSDENLILADNSLAFDELESSGEIYKYLDLDTSSLERGAYSLDVLATDYNSGLKNMKRMVFAVI